MRFETDFYRPLDLRRAASDQYGPYAELWPEGEHLCDLRVRVDGELYDLDPKLAVTEEHGKDWTLVTVGVHKDDWRAFRFADPDHLILPVMLIASDRFHYIGAVRQGLACYESVLARVQDWYDSHVGASLRLLKPLVLGTELTAKQWNCASDITCIDEYRFALLHGAIQAYEDRLPKADANLRIILAPYTGDGAEKWLGAASQGGYIVAPPRATSLMCPASTPLGPQCNDSVYAIGHELGHTLELDHSCDSYPVHPQCDQSIMETGKPPDAILLQPEICTLLKSPFFHQAG